jgi:two-component system sensor histidine kinase/response regulator
MQTKLYNVLIVDDSSTNLQVLGKLLKGSSFQVFTAESGKAALKMISEEDIPDVILLDIMMPEMDGFAFKRELNLNPKWVGIPVIVISALQEQDDKSKAFELGCVDYMVKPINKMEVINRINVQINMKEQRDELRMMNEELTTANDTRDKIFSIISHDLRTSIGNIKNVFKYMIDGLIDIEEDKELIVDAEITSRNTYNLLENLLYWAKSQQGQIFYRPELVNVSEIVNNVLEIEKGSIVNKEIICEETIEDHLLIWTDKVLFTIIIRNLLGNAIKFSKERGLITIIAKKEDKFVKISVNDHGVGISEENLKKLRSKIMFTTVGTSNEKGTGIGLVLVNDFVKKCNGEFHINSELGKGSQFVVLLPNEGH